MALTMNNHVFKGHKTLLGNKFVTYRELDLPLRADIYQYSKNGFDWGNTSKGAMQLSFAILYQLSNQETAVKYAKDFCKDIVQKLNSRDWILNASDVLSWIEKNCVTTEEQEQPTTKKRDIKRKRIKKEKSNIVKEICQELNITQKQLAKILEVPEGTVSSWAVKNEIPRLGKKAIEFYMQNVKNQKIVDSYKNFITLLQTS
ncbi:MAG TPA: XRE family transcriptional regulator [Sulfurimonas autotrophica]|nr:XRE family transcriptional regulator [Sulfurimonas autotrophica]